MPAHLPVSDRICDKLWFYVNFDCNQACSYCVADAGPGSTRQSLSLEAFRTLATQGVAAGFREILITGGEPLLHPEIGAILRFAASLLPTTLLTNATLVKSCVLNGLAYLSDRLLVQVSLDSPTPAIHDQLRGRGSWQAAVEGIDLLLAAGFRVGTRTTVNRQTKEDLSALRMMLEGMGIPVERILMSRVVIGGRSPAGTQIPLGNLLVEPTVAADGLYIHPLKVHPSLAAARDPIPLASALETLAAQLRELAPAAGPARQYR